jgi:opacity protein-like surface antigen
MRRSMTCAVALLLIAGANAVQAQGGFAVEVRGGAAIPAEDMGQAELKTGGGAELTLGARVLPHVWVYGGWAYYQLRTDPPVAAAKIEVETTGYAFGAQFQHPVMERVAGFVRAGGIVRHVEIEDRAGDVIADSGHELGWEAGGGLNIAIGRNLALTPGVRYSTLPVTIQNVDVDLSFVAIDIGLRYSFGGGPLVTALRR